MDIIESAAQLAHYRHTAEFIRRLLGDIDAGSMSRDEIINALKDQEEFFQFRASLRAGEIAGEIAKVPRI